MMRSVSNPTGRVGKSRRSRLVLPVAALVAAVAIAGCSSDSGDDKASDTTAKAGGSELSLVTDGQLTVCSDMPYKPFEFEENGETTGFDYQVVSAMAKKMNLSKADFQTTPFDGIIPALIAKNCDMIASAMTITEERAKKVTFTDPYFDADQSLLVLKENAEKYKTLKSLAGQNIGVQSGTTGETYTEENLPDGATVKKFQTGDEMFPALISGDIAGALQDLPVNGYRATTAPDQFVVTETFKTGEQYGFAVRKEDTALAEALNTALADIKADGTYDEIYAKWFGEKK